MMSNQSNVLFIILDSARAKNMSVYGYDRTTTPFLEKFVEEATLYSQARSPGIHSIASHVSMFTGKHVEEHLATNHAVQIDVDQTIWSELNRDHGFNTGLFTNNRIISSASNLSDAFNYVDNPSYSLTHSIRERYPLFEDAHYPNSDPNTTGILGNLRTSLSHQKPLKSITNCIQSVLTIGAVAIEDRFLDTDGDYKTLYGERFTNEFLNWESAQDGPWAACINLMDTHWPYEPLSEYDRWSSENAWEILSQEDPSIEAYVEEEAGSQLDKLEPLYDGTILQVDSILEELISELKERETLQDTLLIITSDHGEGFYEISGVDPRVRIKGHLWGIHEVLTHVPLIIKYPNQLEGKIVDEVVSLTDIPHLIRQVIGDKSKSTKFPINHPVLSSTLRLTDDQIAKLEDGENALKYSGPWRAVYENQDDYIRKYSQRHNNFLIEDIQDAMVSEIVSRCEHEKAKQAFRSLSEAGVRTNETSEIDDELEDHLKDLGYIN